MRHKGYNKRIEVHEKTYSKDELGDKTYTGTSKVKELWASVETKSKEKQVEYGQVKIVDRVEIKLHYPRTFSITKDNLIKYDGSLYSIVSIVPGVRNKELVITGEYDQS
jgi:SPP1 family predicted phage head-tail adaptor